MTRDEARAYWRERWTRVGERYVAKGNSSESLAFQFRAIEPVLSKHLPSDGKALDFGCGPQRFRKVFEAAGMEYDGVDLIEELATIPLGETLPVQAYDVVFAAFVLQHIVSDEEYEHWAQQLLEATKPGGTLIIVDAHPSPSYAGSKHMCPRGYFPIMNAPCVEGGKVYPMVPDAEHYLAVMRIKEEG